MVGWFGVLSWPIAIGSPNTLFPTTTATAPASCALRILVENVHAPRVTSAIAPLRLPAGNAAHAVLRPFTPAPKTTASGIVRSEATVAKPPIAPANVGPPNGVMGAPMKCPTVAAPAVSARAADPGDSTVKWPGPELPAA